MPPPPDPREDQIVSRRLERSEPVERYVEKALLQALGRKGEPFRLEVPRAGVRSLVYFIRFESSENGRIVLRCVPKRDDARWLSAALDLFEKNELRAPRPVYRDVSLFSRWRWGWSVFVEEFVEGKALEESAAAAALEGLGRAYAAVHAVQSPTWDRPHRPRGGEMIAESIGWLEKISRRAARDAPPDIASGFERGLAAIREERPGEPISYSLCHKRVTPANVIVKPDGTCVLIDLERVKFGSHLEELARIRLDVLGGSSERFRSFLDGYGEESSPDRVPDLEGPEWRWHLRFLELKRAEEAAAARDYPACRRWLEVKSG